jgi:hypothetical protein
MTPIYNIARSLLVHVFLAVVLILGVAIVIVVVLDIIVVALTVGRVELRVLVARFAS